MSRVIAAGFAAALLMLAQSALAQVPPASYTAKCNSCHLTPPTGARVNGAASASVVNSAINNPAVTGAMSAVTFGPGELTAIINYLQAVFSPGFSTAINTTANVPGILNLTAADVALFTPATGLDTLETGSGPSVPGATITYNTGTPSITYTPANCYVGGDSFSYRARNATTGQPASGATTSSRTINVTVGNPTSAPVLTPGAPPAGTTGVAYPGFTVTGTNCPTSFSALNLPPGLSINNAGLVSGTPTTAGTFNATITGTNAGGLMGSQGYTFNISLGAPVITSGGASGAVGVVFTPYQITATNGPPFIAIGATGLPPGLTVNASGLITGTPTVAGNFTVTLSAQNATGTGTAMVTFAIAVGVPVINSPTNATGQTLVPFSYQITATNSPTSFTATPLPAGLTVNTGTGLISGTPTAIGTTPVTVTATNGTGTNTVPFTLTIDVTLGPPQITSPTTANGGLTVPFNYQITATNNPTSFNATGLPGGLSVNTGTGAITGTPTAAGTFNVNLSATNNVPLTGNQTLVLTIAAGPPVVTSLGPFSGQTGVAATFQLTATNGPTSFAAAPLPAGLTLNTASGQITGTPTAVGSTIANVTATNGAGTSPVVMVTFNITLGPPTITSPTTAGGSQGAPFTYQITALNNPTAFNATGLPPGLAVNTGTGLISGTPTTNGTFNGSVSATNATATANQAVTFTISFGSPVITSPATAGGSSGQPFGYQITASNAPTSFNATGLPPGIFVNTATGLISGTPGASGTFNATISATNGSGTGTAALTITISLSAPFITSPTSIAATTDTAVSYQITATNFPTSFGATGLPAGLTIDTASGIISGTPTVGGTITATISATNGSGTGTATLTFTITFVAPVVKDISVTVQFQTATAINLPITGQFTKINIVTMPEHGILSTPAPGVAVITYTPAIGFSGEDLFTYTVTGPGGTSSVAMVMITVPTFKPVVAAVTMTVELNTPTTLDLRPFITGSGVTGVSIPKVATHGTVTIDGTKVTYTPKHNYFGADTFSYIAFGNAGISSPGVVTVNVIGRPDPSKDPNVVSLLDSQAQTAKRFSRAQISNYQRRLESMHVPPAPVRADPEPLTAPAAAPEKKSQAAPATNVASGAATLAPVTDPRAVDAAKGNPLAAALTGTVVGMATSNSLNLALSTDSGGSGKKLATNAWIGGMANFGRRDATDDAAQSTFSTDGITVGVDRRLSDRLALGIGIGYARDRTEFGGDGSKSKADGTSIAGYGSYHPTGNTFVDWMLGYGVINYDSTRFVEWVDDFATGRRKGRQFFGSIAAGYERRWMDMLLSPYGRLDFSFDKLRQSTETGAGLNALTYLDQTQRTTSLAAGLRVESRHEADFGIVAPRARVEYRHDFDSGRGANIQYADGFAGLTYSVTPTGTSRNFLVLGLGVDFMLRRGLSFGIDYQGQRSSGASSAQAIRFQLTQELDGPGLPNIGWTSLPFANPIRVEGGYTYDDNVTRGREPNEKLSDRVYSLNIGMDKVFFPSKYTKATATALLSVDKFHTYTGLGRFSVGGQGELLYRSSGEFDAMTYGITGRALYDKFESDLRTGSHYALGLNIRRSLTDRIDLFGEVARNVRYGRSDVFDLKDTAVKFNIDYSLGMNGAFYFAGEYRKGQLFASGRPSLVSLALADVFAPDDAFPGGEFSVYRLEGKTVLGTVGFNYPLGPRDSIDFSWRRVQTRPSGRPDFDFSGKLRYIDNQYSIVYLMRF